jgi:glycosyl transferase family 87
METKGRKWRPQLLTVLALGLALLGVGHVARDLPSRANGNDFAHYYISSRLLLAGADLYSTPLQPEYERWGFRYTHPIPTATNPPLLVVFFTPFARLTPGAAFWAWVILEVFSLVCVLALTWWLLGNRLSVPAHWLVCGAAIASAPVYWHFFFSQSQLLIAAIILLAYACLRNGRPMFACLAVTTAMWLKLFPVVLLPWFLWRSSREWNARWKYAARVLMWSATLVLASGLGHWQQFWTQGMKVVEDWIVWQRHFNFTVPSFVKNAAWLSHDFNPEWNDLHAWANLGAIIGLALIVLMYVICWRNGRERADADLESEFCLLSAAMLAGVSEAWGHYFVLLIFPAAVALVRVVQRPTPWRIITLVASLVMLNLMGDWRSPWLEFIVSYIPLYGLLLLGALFVVEIFNSHSTTATSTRSVPPPS